MIAGLGNPGKEYVPTRHNIGFTVLDRLSKKWRAGFNSRQFNSLIGEGVLAKRWFVLIKPLTMMNNSGKAVKKALSFHDLDSSKLLIICDDFNLSLGTLRLRRGGSSGGHRGLQSIIDELGTNQFARLRIGIGLPPEGEEASDYVLKDFLPQEKEYVDNMIVKAVKAIEIFFRQGIEKAMQWSNRREICCE